MVNIEIDEGSGFCFGVTTAIRKAEEELAKGKKDIVIISSDHTRPVPSKIITPILLRRIRSVSSDARIRILVATGFHRPSTHEELVDKYGEEIVAK